MAEYRQNADWSESDHPRDEDGKFTDKQSKFDKQQSEKEKLTSKFRDTNGKPTSKRKQEKLSKQQFAIMYSARAEKIARQTRKGKIPKEDYVFTDGLFVVYKNINYEKFSIELYVSIEGNEDYIDAIWREIDGE